MTDIHAIAADMVAMTNAGDFHIGEKYWADDVISIEAFDGPMARVEGREAVMGKSAWWYGAHEVHGTTTAGPYINGDQIAIHWTMDITNRKAANGCTPTRSRSTRSGTAGSPRSASSIARRSPRVEAAARPQCRRPKKAARSGRPFASRHERRLCRNDRRRASTQAAAD